MRELDCAIYGTKEAVSAVILERVEVEPKTLKSLSNLLQHKSKDRNKRVGKGEASIFQLMFNMGEKYHHIILSSDSDVRTLYKNVRVSE